MTDNTFDLIELLPSPYGDDVWFSLLLPDEIEKLTRLHRAIITWQDVAEQEFKEFEQEVAKKRKQCWDHYDYDPVRDEAFFRLDTERVMLANLAVSIASTAENIIINICNHKNVRYMNQQRQTDFGVACSELGKALNVPLSHLPGFNGNQRARILGNCFKHSGRRTNERYVEKYGGDLDVEIEYELENWPSFIDDTKTFLSEIISRLK